MPTSMYPTDQLPYQHLAKQYSWSVHQWSVFHQTIRINNDVEGNCFPNKLTHTVSQHVFHRDIIPLLSEK